MDELEKLRAEIDLLDGEICELFIKRMKISEKIGKYKKERNLPVSDLKREAEILKKLSEKENGEKLIELYKTVFEISRQLQ